MRERLLRMKRKITLDCSAVYRIEIQGRLDRQWFERMGVVIAVDLSDGETTILTCEVDQAALHGLLRRLYAHGLPLVSLHCIEVR
jgi:hypothetical protein